MKFLQEITGRALAMLLLPLRYLASPEGGDNGDSAGVWLIGENQGECLEDNGFAFYLYCKDCHPGERIYFLIKKSSPYYLQHFRGDDKVILYGSLRHILLFSKATVLFYTHTYRDLMYRRFFEYSGTRARLVYLHHGTLGFKKIDEFCYRNRNLMDICTVGSELERDILVKQVGVDEPRVKITGYARWDRLASDRSQIESQILYIPTHRRHFLGGDKLAFVNRLDDLCKNPALNKLLIEHDLVLKVYPHAHMQKSLTLKPIENPRIRLVELGEESVRHLICASKIMITDYSSVCWEFLAQEKPVIFYRWDIESFVASRDSYIDLRDESFGEIAYDESQLIDLLSQYLDGTRQFQQRILKSIGNVVSEGEGGSCERIYKLSAETLGQPSVL